MNNIPRIFQSSVDPDQVSLTVQSVGKAGAALIIFMGMVGVVDPSIANLAWGNFVASVITAIPAGFAVYHSGQAVWGIIRKIAVGLNNLFNKPTPPAAQ